MIVNKKAFTLIEMVVSITIIAILTAVLLPKVFDFRDDAEVAHVDALRSALQLAVNEVHSLSVQQGPNNLIIPYRGFFVFVDSSSFYPEAVGATNVPAAATSAVDDTLTDVVECIALWENLLVQAPTVGTTAASCTDGCEFVASITGSVGDMQCDYTYQQDTTLVVHYSHPEGEVS